MLLSRIVPLSLFLAAAALSFASGTASSSSFSTITYSFDAGISIDDVTEGDYGSPYTFDPHGSAVANYTENRSSSHTGSTFEILTETSTTFSATTFASADNFVGRHYFLSVSNASGIDQTITFDFACTRSSSASVDDPARELAQSWTYSGVQEFSTGEDEFRTLMFSTGTSNPISDNQSLSFSKTYTIGAGMSEMYEVWASADAYVQYSPVPEPASIAALGLGAAAMLRRRRRTIGAR